MFWENPSTPMIIRPPSTPEGVCAKKGGNIIAVLQTGKPDTVAIYDIDFSACSGTRS